MRRVVQVSVDRGGWEEKPEGGTSGPRSVSRWSRGGGTPQGHGCTEGSSGLNLTLNDGSGGGCRGPVNDGGSDRITK